MDKKYVVKSKSSSSAITSGSRSRKATPMHRLGPGEESKRRAVSSAHFQSPGKKRGMYVEKRTTKTSLGAGANQQPEREKSKRSVQSRARSHNEAAQTQQNDSSEPVTIRTKVRGVQKRNTVDSATQHMNFIRPSSPSPTPQAKNRFKSKFLNGVQKQQKDDQLIVIQAKKPNPLSVASSRSHDASEKVSNSRNTLPLQMKDIASLPNATRDTMVAKKFASSTRDIAKKMSVAKKASEQKKLLRIDEPNTLVGEDNGLYSFFVDLLETTFGVYNVQTEYDITKDKDISKLKLPPIEPDVASKLKVKVSKNDDLQANDEFNVEDDRIMSWDEQQIQVMKREPRYKNALPPTKPQRKIASRSYTYSGHVQNNKDEKTQKKKRNPKQTLLNILKAELQMDSTYREPQNMHQALELIAKKKQRQDAQRVSFKQSDDGSCQFKRKKVISSSTKSKKRKKDKDMAQTFQTKYIRNESPKRNQSPKSDDEYQVNDISEPSSVGTIEVKGYDYDNDKSKRVFDLHNKQVLYTGKSLQTVKSDSLKSEKTESFMSSKNVIPSLSSLSVYSETINNILLDLANEL